MLWWLLHTACNPGTTTTAWWHDNQALPTVALCVCSCMRPHLHRPLLTAGSSPHSTTRLQAAAASAVAITALLLPHTCRSGWTTHWTFVRAAACSTSSAILRASHCAQSQCLRAWTATPSLLLLLCESCCGAAHCLPLPCRTLWKPFWLPLAGYCRGMLLAMDSGTRCTVDQLPDLRREWSVREWRWRESFVCRVHSLCAHGSTRHVPQSSLQLPKVKMLPAVPSTQAASPDYTHCNIQSKHHTRLLLHCQLCLQLCHPGLERGHLGF